MVAYAIALALLASQALYKIFKLRSTIRAAKQTGLPYTISPIHELEVWAHVADPILRWACSARILRGQGWPRWARFMVKDWHYEDKRRAHDEFGAVFLVVSFAGMVCYVGDADVAAQVLTRRRAFVKPREKMKMLEPFGPNVVSLDGEKWKAHLAITLPPVAADNVLRLLWEETYRQVDIMATTWNRAGEEPSLKRNIYSLTMNTMLSVGFGKQSERAEGSDTISRGHVLSLVEAMYTVVMHLPHILLLAKPVLRFLKPEAFIGYTELERYMNELLKQERDLLSKENIQEHLSRETLMTAMLRSNLNSQSNGLSLTDNEVMGNMFIFLLAGYDTTANTIIFCCMVLALYPDIQDRLIEEVDRIWAEAAQEGRSELSHTQDMPKFRYMIAFMYEVMRAFPIVLPTVRDTSGPQVLSFKNTTHSLPPDTGVIVNNTGIHYDCDNWPNPGVIDPRRWLVSDPHSFEPNSPLSPAHAQQIDEGSAKIPGHRRATFLAFGEGPRACLGRSFARTEFVAFNSLLLRKYKLQLGCDVSGVALERMIRFKSGGSPVTLTPPEDVHLDLVERV